jgi:hypothetical protein
VGISSLSTATRFAGLAAERDGGCGAVFGRFDWDQLHRLRFALSSSSGPKFRLLAEQFGWAGISFLPFYVGTRLAGGCVPLVFSSTMSLELVNTVRIAYMFDSVKRETQDSCKNS